LLSLTRIAYRYLFRHPWQTVLMVIGITLGVAVVVAIDLANASASRAFDLSAESVTGRATHQISGGPEGLDETLYTNLLRKGLDIAAAPVLTEYISSSQLGGQPLQLLGIDPLADAPFRDYLGTGGSSSSGLTDLTAFLTQPGALLVSSDMAQTYGLKACPTGSITPACQLSLDVNGRPSQAFIAGLLKPADALSRRALDGLVIADIATAQELTGQLGKLDRIDLILPADQAATLTEKIQAFLPAGVRLQPVEARSGVVEQMTAAFRVNLTALSLLALVVGMFLIYNTITFSVVQRRPLFGTLRCLGVTRQEVFWIVMGEALLVGLLGAGLGIGLGILMGQGAVRMVTQTINDLFFVVTVRGVQVPITSLVKGGLLGVLASLLTAAPPAWEAASVPPRLALSRSGLESKARLAVKVAAAIGLGLIILGLLVLLVPTRSLAVSFGGTFAVVVGFAMLAPLATRLLMRGALPALGRAWGSLGRMAPRDVVSSLSRTSIAIAALMVAVSVTIGVSLMVGSFRNTVVTWLGQTLQGDVYISMPSLSGTSPSAAIDPAAVAQARFWPGVSRVDVLRSVEVDAPQGPVHVAATDNFSVANERIYLTLDGPIATVWSRLQQGGVLVSEPLANRLGLPRRGGVVTLNTDQGAHNFPVLGIYYDYASTQGTVLMNLDVYRMLWHDPTITAVDLRLAPGADPESVAKNLQAALSPVQKLLVRPNRALRQDVLVIFDRTFAITGALQLLATVVAFIGILSALLSLELERQRELGILRAVGLTVRQLWGLILLETGLMGAAAGLLAMPTGYALALVLVYIINKRSFGWTLQMQVLPAPFIQALAVAIVAALLAGIYPAWRMSRKSEADAIRFE
jgi:putative ABC transport system permease protein